MMFLLTLILVLGFIVSVMGMFYRIFLFKAGKLTGEEFCGKNEWDKIMIRKTSYRK